MKKNIIPWLCKSAAVLAFAASSAYATPTVDSVRFSLDGTTWLPANVVTDADGDGAISASFVGNGFNLRVVTTLTFPLLGTAGSPQMDLNIQGLSGTAGQSVWVEFSVQDFSPIPAGHYLTTAIGTVDSGSQSETTRIGNTDTLFADGTSPGQTFSTIGPLSGTASGMSTGTPGVGQPNPYSITIAEVITSTGGPGNLISTDDRLKTVPDGGNTLMLLGSALSVLGFGAFRKARKA